MELLTPRHSCPAPRALSALASFTQTWSRRQRAAGLRRRVGKVRYRADNTWAAGLSTVRKFTCGRGYGALYMYRVSVHWPMGLLDR
jgi:hypothetical protein